MPLVPLIVAGLLAADLRSSEPERLSIYPGITVSTGVVHVRDLVNLASLPVDLAGKVANVEVLELPRGRAEVRLREADVARLLRLHIPVIAHWLPQASGQAITIRLEQSHPLASRGERTNCLVATRSIDAGAIAMTGAFAPAPCAANKLATFWYDAQVGAFRTRRALVSGEVVGSYPDAAGHGVVPGQKIALISWVKGVTIERPVEALQTGLPGSRLFVQDSDGSVFAVRLGSRVP